MRRVVAGLLLLFAAPSVGAQREAVVAKRPKLPVGVDTNDAHAYYQLGHEVVNRNARLAADAFYWATRLNPYAADAFYGRHAALLLDDPRRLARYMDDDPGRASPETKQLDSLFMRALMLDPFVFRKYEHLVLRQYFRRAI